jgi:uncharacterized cupredoxin-like copper-binding protein
MRALLALVVAILAVGGLVTLASGDGGEGRTVAVVLDEWSVEPALRTVHAGRVAFETSNEGRVDHELLVVRTKLPADKLGDPRFAGVYAVGAPHDHFAQAAGLGSRHLVPGRRRVDVATLTPGDYVLFCSLPGHYARGQRAALRVTR